MLRSILYCFQGEGLTDCFRGRIHLGRDHRSSDTCSAICCTEGEILDSISACVYRRLPERNL